MTRLLLLLVLLATPTASAQSPARCAGGRAVDADDLRAAGAGRLGDALRLVAPLRGWTVDGFDAEPRDARGALTLVLDGVPWQGTSTVEPGMLDALPVAVSEVREIVYCPGTFLIAGRLMGPTLNVWTAPPPTAAALADYGNETGDPGPARYLDPSLPNSDHWGPDGELVARAGRAWATLRARSFLPTDTAIVARTSAASARFPEHQTLLGAITTRSESGRSIGRVAAFASGELPFLPRAEREVAVRRRWAQAGARWGGEAYAPVAHAWGGVRTLGAPTWAAPDSIVARVSDWRETSIGGSAGVSPFSFLPVVTVGARGALTSARGDDRLPDFDAPIPQQNAAAATVGLWAEVERGRVMEEGRLRSLPNWMSRLSGEATLSTRADGGVRPGGGVSAYGSLNSASWGPRAVQWAASVRHTPAAVAPDAGYWRAAGLAPLVRDGGAGADIATDDLSVRVDVIHPVLFSDETHASTGVSLAVGRTRSSEPVATLTDGAPVLVQTEAWLRRWAETTTWAYWKPGAAWRLTADGAVTFTDSESVGGAVWPEAPTAQASVGAAYQPNRTLALSARAEASTASHSRAARGDLPSRIPGGVVVDLSLRRSVWKDRLALALTGHNVLGAPEQPSALGARLGPRLHIRLIGRF